MIYLNCDECGLRFRKGHFKNPKCLRCGNNSLWEEDIPNNEVTEFDRIADKYLRDSYRKSKKW